MKHLTDSTADRLTVVELFVFDPWPFESAVLPVNLPWLSDKRSVRPDKGWTLADRTSNAIAVLSDGTRCVTDPTANPVGTVVTR